MTKIIANTSLVTLIIIFFTACGGGSSGSTPEPAPEPAVDTSVNTFVIDEKLDIEPDTEVISNSITIQGINQAVNLSVDGCSYSLNQQQYQTQATTVNNSDTLTFKIMSSVETDTTVSCEINVSQYMTQFFVTTRLPLVELKVLAKTGGNEETQLTPTRIFIHDENAENLTELEVISADVVIPDSANGVSYTVSVTTDIYGYTFHNLFTSYNTDLSQTHRIWPEDPGYLFDNCKTVSLSKDTFEQLESWLGFYTANRCTGYIGKGSSTGQSTTSIQLDVINDANATDDLIYFTQDDQSNFLGYKLLSSSDYSDGETIDANNITLNTDFNLLSFSFDSIESGDVVVFGRLENGLGLILGEHELYPGSNAAVVNLANIPYDEYSLGLSFWRNDQRFYFRKYSEEIPSFFDRQLEKTFFLSADINRNVLSWNVENQVQFTEVIFQIRTTINGEEYFWEIYADNNGSLAIPDIAELNTQDFLKNARVFIYLYSWDETVKESESLFVAGGLECLDGICSLSLNL